MNAIETALNRLEGSYGLVIMREDDPGKLVTARNGSPLLVGISENKHWIASEHTAFARHTNQYIALKDGEIATVEAGRVSLDSQRTEMAPEERIKLSPAPYAHWTLREIMEQPTAVSRSLSFGARLGLDGVVLGGLETNKEMLQTIENLIITGCGTSLFAGLYGAKLFRYLRVLDSVTTQDAGELGRDSLPRKNGGVLAISQSGETKDVHRCVETSMTMGIPTFSVVNSVGSLIARTTGVGVYTYAGRETAVASTKAFITQVSCLALVALWFAKVRGAHRSPRAKELEDSLQRLPTQVGQTLVSCQEQIQEIAYRYKDAEHMFVIGKGFAEPIAREGALKIKEITYIHAEGYSGSALKHGPFALIEKGTPIVALVLDDEHGQKMRTAVHEVEARGASTIVITDNPDLCNGLKAEVIRIPSNGLLTALLGVLPMQLLAYHLAIARGIDPDKPKNLAKSVTVD